jgi:DNA invertase Pin-like site-specific DNA recombinase
MSGEPKVPPSDEGELHPRKLRCAIYTRKSTEEGLNQEFNTLEAQREAAEAYICSQLHAGWIALGERYDDGGYTGANLERPALRKLLADIQAGEIDCVLVYKIDRLSRSLLDFARLMEIFERHQVSLVSITQPLNTTASLGRLTLNILLSFAQFEREMIADRTRDKMAAARRKGKWVGGTPVLGYDIAEAGGKLTVNAEEARRVQAIFELYLQRQSVKAALAEIQAQRWTTKQWRGRDGNEHLGRPFTKRSLERLLKNVLYLGQVSCQGEIYAGEQTAIVEQSVWRRTQAQLAAQQDGARVVTGPSTVATKMARHGGLLAQKGERTERVPRIARLLALALKFEELIRSGVVSNYAALAQVARVSRSRVTQMTGLLNLAPDIQEEILFLRPEEAKLLRISEPSLRRLTATLLWNKQRELWRGLRPSLQNRQVGIQVGHTGEQAPLFGIQWSERQIHPPNMSCYEEP